MRVCDTYVEDNGGRLLGAATGGANLHGHGRVLLIGHSSDLLAKHKAGKRECGKGSQHCEICRQRQLLPRTKE